MKWISRLKLSDIIKSWGEAKGLPQITHLPLINVAMPGAKHYDLFWREEGGICSLFLYIFFISEYFLLCSSLLANESNMDHAKIILKYIMRLT